MRTDLLYHKIIGTGPPVVILHGLIGSSDNWHTFSKKLSEDFQVILCDLRNHGRSFHDQEWNYEVMAQDVYRVLDYIGIQRFNMVGHSLGGKVGLMMLHQEESRIQKLLVLDIANKDYASAHNHLFMAMNALPISTIQSRREADEFFQMYESNYSVRQLILKNLQRTPQGFSWKINVPVIQKNYPQILKAIPFRSTIDTPVCFVKGEISEYIEDDDMVKMSKTFVNSEIIVLKKAGHWLHVDAPEELFLILQRFLIN